MTAKGDAVTFRSISGLNYEAVLVALHPNIGRCSIDVNVGAKDFFPLTMVRWSERPTEDRFTAWPKEAENGVGAEKGERNGGGELARQ
jgi:hypothetical protein